MGVDKVTCTFWILKISPQHIIVEACTAINAINWTVVGQLSYDARPLQFATVIIKLCLIQVETDRLAVACMRLGYVWKMISRTYQNKARH